MVAEQCRSRARIARRSTRTTTTNAEMQCEMMDFQTDIVGGQEREDPDDGVACTVSRGDENRRESDDKSVMNRQRQGTLPRYDHHLCSDTKRFSEMTIIYTSIQMVVQINQRSSLKARMTKLTMSDETLEERVIAVGKKRNLHLVFYQRDVPD